MKRNNEIETAIHLSLQGKGGVGKSLVASILAQYFIYHGSPIRCIDTDPVNQTFAQYKRLPVERVKLIRNGSIDPRGFDALMETLLTSEGVFVVDNGASTFVPLWNYFLENNTLELLRNSGRRVYVHSIVTGGQAMDDTLEGFRQLAESITDQIFVVWINEYFGRVEWQGKGFLDMAVYRDNQQKILGSVAIPKRNQDTFGRDVEEMISRKQTFDEAIESDGTMIMTKQRLKVIQHELFRQLDAVPIVPAL
jgi:hypothetical protein